MSEVSNVTHPVINYLCCTNRHSRLVDNDGPGLGVLEHEVNGRIEGCHVGRGTCALPFPLGRRVYADEDGVGDADALFHLGGEEEVPQPADNGVELGHGGSWATLRDPSELDRLGPVPGDSQDFLQAWLVNRRVPRVPAANLGLVVVDDGESDRSVVQCEDCSRRSA